MSPPTLLSHDPYDTHINMSPPKPLFAIVPLAILLLPVGMYLADRAASSNEVARNVTVAGVPVGGMNHADATLKVKAYENQLRTNTGAFSVNDHVFKLSPITIGLDAAVSESIDSAFSARRSGGIFADFRSWILSFSSAVDVPLGITFDDDAINRQVELWESEAVPVSAFDGTVAVVDGVVVVTYPRTGQGINRETAHALVVAEMSTLDKRGGVLEVIESIPLITRADIDNAAAELALMIDAPITMVSAQVGFRTTFRAADLASAARADVSTDRSEIVTSFDRDRVLQILEPHRGEYESQPLDARFAINMETDDITIISGRSGTLLDVENLLIEMRTAALGSGNGSFPLLIGTPPAFTTEDARSFTNLRPLAGFTTFFAASQPRVINIHKISDSVNGAIVLPGEEWSINEHVGKRTEAKGYVAAPAIIDGEPYCCDHPVNIGGGVSQFSTTLFNAVFFSCLEHTGHRPHSLHFPRYPMGREATLGKPEPDLRFRNNTQYPIVIATGYTATTVTVKLYGDNGGLICTDVTHEQEEIVEFEEELVADTEGILLPGEREHLRDGLNGFLIRVDRVVTHPDGRSETDMNLVHRYRPLSSQYLVHPCEVTGEAIDCPVVLVSVLHLTWINALDQLADIGLLAAKITGFVDDPTKDGVVLTQNPAPGQWIDAGSTVTLTIGEYDE